MRIQPIKLLALSVLFFIIVSLGIACQSTINNSDEALQIEEMSNLVIENDSLKSAIGLLEEELSVLEEKVKTLNTQTLPQVQASLNQSSPLSAAVEFVSLLDQEDYSSLYELIHPTEGVRFSPYAFVDVANHQWVDSANLTQFLSGTQVLNWGEYDGTGDPIQLTPIDYINRFVYDQMYIQPELIGFNQIISSGNTLVNIPSVYAGATFIEFHFTGFDPQYMGMDWRSLIIVMKEVSGLWYVVGVVHSEWTI
jgi:hypothetical protein